MFKFTYGHGTPLLAIILLSAVSLAINAAGLFIGAYLVGRGLVAAGL